MHTIEPFYNWEQLYRASEDRRSPFFGRKNSETLCENTIYNYYIHPQWDDFGSRTLYLKLLYVHYEEHFAVIELFGEWNDILYNDVMYLYRNVIEELLDEGIKYFILIGENVLDFHSDTDDYFAEWFDNLEDGWIIGLNFRQHVKEEFREAQIDQYLIFGGEFDELAWRRFLPRQLFSQLNDWVAHQIL